MTRTEAGSRVAVTGASGFVGQTLVENLVSAGYRVSGISDRKEPPARIAHLVDDYVSLDLTNGWPDIGLFDGVVHLAGLAAVGPSFNNPQQYINSSTSMATHLFETALSQNWPGRVIVVSSGAVYGGPADVEGLTEDSPVLPTSPYVVSKLFLELQAAYYANRGIDAIVARPFNHIGPGQRRGFIVPDLTEKVRSRRPEENLQVGNLDSARDYTDVRDIARAYRLLLELEAPNFATYNICTGVARSGWQVLEAICEALEIPVPTTTAKSDRAIDPPAITGNSNRIRLETGWEPTIEFQTSITEFIRGDGDSY